MSGNWGRETMDNDGRAVRGMESEEVEDIKGWVSERLRRNMGEK